MVSDFLRKITATQIGEELSRLQQLVETGEIATGARRLDDIPEDDRAVEAAPVLPRSPVTTAQTSTWVPGGAR